jgi:G3E family GTPase
MNRTTGIERSVKNTFKERLLSINPSLEILEEPGEVGIRGLFSSKKASHGVFASEIADQQKTETHDHPFYSIQVREGLNYTNEGALKSWLKEQGAQLVRAKGAAVVNGRKMLVNYTSGVLDIDACPETIKIGITMIFEKPIIHRNFK